MITDRMRRMLKERDPYCPHCGDDVDLVVHHRQNRGMGGRGSSLDRFDNLMRVCQDYNFKMEASEVIALDARQFGHKLSSWQDFSEPIYDACEGNWYVLDTKGGKTLVDAPEESMF